MSPSNGDKVPAEEVKESSLKAFLSNLRKRHIIETLAAFIGGGWLFLEFVDRILIAHYELNKKWLDVSFVTVYRQAISDARADFLSYGFRLS